MKTLTQDWQTGPHAPSYDQNGTWELWMSFGGISCSEAFDAGYDSGGAPCPERFAHPALIEAFQSGWRQFREDHN